MTPDKQEQFEQVQRLVDRLLMVCDSTRLQNLDTALLDEGIFDVCVGVGKIMQSIEVER